MQPAAASTAKCTAVSATVESVKPAGTTASPQRVAVVLRLPPTKCPQVVSVYAEPGQPLHAAKQGQAITVYMAGNKVCMTPPAAPSATACLKGGGGMCTPWAAMVQRVRTHENKIRQVELAFNPGDTKRMDRVFAARPGTSMYDAKPGQVWKVWLRNADWNVCYHPEPEKMREKCKDRRELPVCAYTPGAAPTGTCSEFDGMVTEAPQPQTNGVRPLKLAFHIEGRRVDRTLHVRPGDKMYGASEGQVWRVWLDDGNKAVCPRPQPVLSRLRCTSIGDLPVCRYGGSVPASATGDAPPSTCTPFAGLVTAIAADSQGRKRITLVFKVDGRRLERTYQATEGSAMYSAQAHQVWKVPLDTAAGHTVCYAPAPELMRAKCSSADDLPVCEYVVGLPAGFMPMEAGRGGRGLDAGPLVTVWTKTSTTPPGYMGCYSNMDQLVCRKDDGTVSGGTLAPTQVR